MNEDGGPCPNKIDCHPQKASLIVPRTVKAVYRFFRRSLC